MRTAMPVSATDSRHDIDWDGLIKLAVVLSAIAIAVVVALSGRIAEPVLIVGIIVVASTLSWMRIQPLAEPARVHVRRR